MSSEPKKYNRREFIRNGIRFSVIAGLGVIGGTLFTKKLSSKTVWQIDTKKCTQCGRCATSCVKMPSAVKCFHAYDMCGYCDLCGGYFKPGTKDLTTAAENQLCPTSALKRKFIEEPFFEYHIDEDLCIGCGKCVKGCYAFGNGSLQLQINQHICDNCNECAIARDCPSEAISRVSIDEPYIMDGIDKKSVWKNK